MSETTSHGKTAIILIGGGMRSAHGGGFLYALGKELSITKPVSLSRVPEIQEMHFITSRNSTTILKAGGQIFFQLLILSISFGPEKL